MTVIEYVEMRKKELESFRNDWLKNMEEFAEDWPKTMGDGDWFEQELAFMESIK